MMKVANVGGSNSVLKASYTNIIPSKYGIAINNKGIGATNSIYALINIIKYDLIKQNDLLIFEYFVNDNNHYFQGINNVERICKTLAEIINMCIKWKTKLLFVLIYNKNHQLENKYETSPVYQLYKNIIEKYRIPSIDMYDVLYSKFNDKWHEYYQDKTHLSHEGHMVLSEEIVNKIKDHENQLKYLSHADGKLLNYNNNHDDDNNNNNNRVKGFNSVNVLEIAKYATQNSINNISNSLINLNYVTIDDAVDIEFDQNTEILAIEYICDAESGYIEVDGSGKKCNLKKVNVIQKNTLKKEKFVLEKMKKMASLITFNSTIFAPSNKYTIKIIDAKELDANVYDREKHTLEDDSKRKQLSSFKLVSLLVTNKARIKRIFQ